LRNIKKDETRSDDTSLFFFSKRHVECHPERARGTRAKRRICGNQRLVVRVNIGSSGGQNSRACTVIVPIPRETYSGANVSRYHPATNRPLPGGVSGDHNRRRIRPPWVRL